jgi:hypothetical protein
MRVDKVEKARVISLTGAAAQRLALTDQRVTGFYVRARGAEVFVAQAHPTTGLLYSDNLTNPGAAGRVTAANANSPCADGETLSRYSQAADGRSRDTYNLKDWFVDAGVACTVYVTFDDYETVS